jgi:hypothetical protein
MDDVRGEIARIEEETERLGGTLERCRKVALAAKAAIVIGALWLAALIFGLVGSDAASLLGATIAILGGIVVAGSNATTARETEEKIAEAQERRDALIDEIELSIVPAAPSRMVH